MDVSRIYKGDLARQGVFEGLDPYYERSSLVKQEDLLESVREAYTVKGKNVTVFPFFSLRTLRARGDFVKNDEWTIWKFLELGEKNRMLYTQSPDIALDYCMGIRYYGEHFIDYENKTCSFDGEEFRRILESCGTWEKHSERNESGDYVDSSSKEGEWLFEILTVGSPKHIEPRELEGDYIYEGEDYLSTLAGYPGWEGGEYPLQAYSVFAINSASPNKEGAWDFVEYMLSEEFQAGASLKGLPVNRRAYMEKQVFPGVKGWENEPYTTTEVTGKDGTVTEYDIYWPDEAAFGKLDSMVEGIREVNLCESKVYEEVIRQGEKVLAGELTIEEGVDALERALQIYLAE